VVTVQAVAPDHYAAAKGAGTQAFRLLVFLHSPFLFRPEGSGQIKGMLFQVT
jgi:hypothetical protein